MILDLLSGGDDGEVSILNKATMYFIDPAGDDGTGDGSAALPWLTLSFACSQVTKPGDIIYVNPGNYALDNVRCNLAPGVNILGAGDTSHLQTSYVALNSTDAWILLNSAVEGSPGNQVIRKLKITGNGLVATAAIQSLCRSGVKYDYLTVEDFEGRGLCIRGQLNFGVEPAIYATGCEISNCIVTNCSDRLAVTVCGLLTWSGTDGLYIHDCTLTQNSRAATHNGNIATSWGNYEKNTLWTRNESYKPDTDGVNGWNFHIETGHIKGGCEYSYSEFKGGVALDSAGGDHVPGTAEYSIYFHHNYCYLDAQIGYVASVPSPYGVDLERTNEKVLIKYNFFKNLKSGVITSVAGAYHITDLTIAYNIFYDCGYFDLNNSFSIMLAATNVASLMHDVHIKNNVIIGNNCAGAVCIDSGNEIDNVFMINNIVKDYSGVGGIFAWLVFWDTAGDILNIYARNNILHNNLNNDQAYYRNGKVVANYVDINNIRGQDPLFVAPGNYHLQGGSPGLNAGLWVGELVDYAGNPVTDPPDIGIYQN